MSKLAGKVAIVTGGQVAIRRPALVRKLVAASASYTSHGIQPEVLAMIALITPAAFADTPWLEEYTRVAPLLCRPHKVWWRTSSPL